RLGDMKMWKILAAGLGLASLMTMPGVRVATDASPAPASGSSSVSISDPVLNMTAYTLTIPARWNFEGAVVQGSSCMSNPFPVFFPGGEPRRAFGREAAVADGLVVVG
ncbi:MAG TPA: hypothetical protein VGD60_00315, partial [Candidatus Acidoferrales bacterium]